MKRVLLFLPALLVAGFFLEGAPRRYDDDLWLHIKEIRDSIDDLRREIHNQESEIKTFAEKTATQEDVVDHLQKEFKESYQSQKDLLKNNNGNLEAKIGSLETSNKGLITDLKQIKGHSNEMQDVLKAYRDKLNDLERTTATLSKNMEMLQTAMNHLMDLVKTSSGISNEGGSRTYHVKAGDSLEKIARAHKTTIKALKEANHLTKDQITIGQILRLPE